MLIPCKCKRVTIGAAWIAWWYRLVQMAGPCIHVSVAHVAVAVVALRPLPLESRPAKNCPAVPSRRTGVLGKRLHRIANGGLTSLAAAGACGSCSSRPYVG